MYDLVKGGHVYVAQPPLFRVVNKKQTYYVQTDEEMKAQLLDLGLGDCIFDPRDGQLIEGEAMTKLVRTLAAMEEALIALERRGISLKIHSERQDPVTGKLPAFHVLLGAEEHWFTGREQLDEFIAAKEKELGHELRVDAGVGLTGVHAAQDDDEESSRNGAAASATDANAAPLPKLRIVELHEVRTINTLLGDLATQGFGIEALIPKERTGEEGSRYAVRRGDSESGLEDLRALPGAIRAAGEKGLQITRFKGLGEMNAEELRETTLDPANRTLLQIRMEDAGSADELFRVLMGDNVEPRREFIQKHALDVRNLDV
ncbi:MAG: hypothetical protein KDA44_07115 [Planctomycetales bacterium]|nr:hypothetical protein [Planctomycetales bacterium]